MKQYDDVFEAAKKLHEFTFKKVIQLKENTGNDYSILDENIYRFDDDRKKNGRFRHVVGCCNDCSDCCTPDPEKLKKEKKNDEYKDFKLSYVSHGSHSIDFLRAGGLKDEEIKKEFEDNNWNTTPVLFLMENPSKNYGIYEERDGKYPTTTWYWVHRRLESLSEMDTAGDKYLKQGYYGDMVYSLICKNKLANAYLTNVVKCGMNRIWMEDGKPKDAYLGTWWYQDQCKANCAVNVLFEEIKRLVCGQKKLIVFAFGNNAYYFAKDLLQNLASLRNIDKQLILLPHPSNRLNSTFRKVLLKDYITNVLNGTAGEGILMNLPVVESFNLDTIKDALEKEGIPCNTGKRSSGRAVLKKVPVESFLDNKGSRVRSVYLFTNENIEYGYSFEEESYWIFDYNREDETDDENGIVSLDPPFDETFEKFKKVVDNFLHTQVQMKPELLTTGE